MILQISMMMTSVQALIITRLSLIYYQNGRWWTDRSDPDVLALVTQWQNGLHAWSNHFFSFFLIYSVYVWKSVTLSLREIYRIDSLFTRHTHLCVYMDAGWCCVQYMRDIKRTLRRYIFFFFFSHICDYQRHFYSHFYYIEISTMLSLLGVVGLYIVCVCPIIIGQHQFSRNIQFYIYEEKTLGDVFIIDRIQSSIY